MLLEKEIQTLREEYPLLGEITIFGGKLHKSTQTVIDHYSLIR